MRESTGECVTTNVIPAPLKRTGAQREAEVRAGVEARAVGLERADVGHGDLVAFLRGRAVSNSNVFRTYDFVGRRRDGRVALDPEALSRLDQFV